VDNHGFLELVNVLEHQVALQVQNLNIQRGAANGPMGKSGAIGQFGWTSKDQVLHTTPCCWASIPSDARRGRPP
jgi:hypothetical protein